MSLALPPLRIVREVSRPVTFEVITGNRYLHALEPDWGQEAAQVRAFRERSTFVLDDATGLVVAETEYGTYSYHWPPAHRGEDLFTFLASLHFDYFMGKAAKQAYREIDLEATIAEYRAELHRDLRGHELKGGIHQAREIRDELTRLTGEVDRRSENDFLVRWGQSSELSRWREPYDVSVITKDTYQARHFWDVIWSALIESPDFIAHKRPHERKQAHGS